MSCLEETRHTVWGVTRVCFATFMAAFPSVLCVTGEVDRYSTAFCLNVFGMKENIDITVFESRGYLLQMLRPLAACMKAYGL